MDVQDVQGQDLGLELVELLQFYLLDGFEPVRVELVSRNEDQIHLFLKDLVNEHLHPGIGAGLDLVEVIDDQNHIFVEQLLEIFGVGHPVLFSQLIDIVFEVAIEFDLNLLALKQKYPVIKEFSLDQNLRNLFDEI